MSGGTYEGRHSPVCVDGEKFDTVEQAKSDAWTNLADILSRCDHKDAKGLKEMAEEMIKPKIEYVQMELFK